MQLHYRAAKAYTLYTRFSSQGRQRALTWLGATAVFSSLRGLFAGGAARALDEASLRQPSAVSRAQQANFRYSSAHASVGERITGSSECAPAACLHAWAGETRYALTQAAAAVQLLCALFASGTSW